MRPRADSESPRNQHRPAIVCNGECNEGSLRLETGCDVQCLRRRDRGFGSPASTMAEGSARACRSEQLDERRDDADAGNHDAAEPYRDSAFEVGEAAIEASGLLGKANLDAPF